MCVRVCGLCGLCVRACVVGRAVVWLFNGLPRHAHTYTRTHLSLSQTQTHVHAHRAGIFLLSSSSFFVHRFRDAPLRSSGGRRGGPPADMALAAAAVKVQLDEAYVCICLLVGLSDECVCVCVCV